MKFSLNKLLLLFNNTCNDLIFFALEGVFTLYDDASYFINLIQFYIICMPEGKFHHRPLDGMNYTVSLFC